MSLKDKFYELIGKKYKPGNRVFVYYDKEGRLLTDEITLTGRVEDDEKVIKKLNAEKILKKINIRELGKVMAKFKVTNQFLLHFFEIMEQQEENINGKIIFDINKIFERLQVQDTQYFEFYKYIHIELNRGKLLGEIIREIKGFENYVEFFDMLDTLKEEDKAKLFGKLKEKILKEQTIKKQIIGPLKQPLIMLAIILSIFVWFSGGMIKDIIVQFNYLGYIDKTPGIIMLIYNIGNFVSTNLITIAFYTSTILLFIVGAYKLEVVKNFIHKIMFSIDFYKYFNELFMGYMMLLQANNKRKGLKDVFYDLREGYRDNKYYYFIFDLIFYNLSIAAEKYIPLRKYGYVLSNEFIIALDQVIKQNKLILINSFLRFVDGKLDQLLKKFSAALSVFGTVIVAGGILILFLGIFLGNNAKSDLLKMESSGGLFEAPVSYEIVDKNKIQELQKLKEEIEKLKKGE